ncbi:hypothetical protein HZS_1292 [Henneguya salminicola]|nr:hypothetical protein HZS_1292 [Henneguya salminicola]
MAGKKKTFIFKDYSYQFNRKYRGDDITFKGDHTCNKTLSFEYLNAETTLAPSSTVMGTFVSEKLAILSLYSHQIYESFLIELRIQYALSVYIISTKSKI